MAILEHRLVRSCLIGLLAGVVVGGAVHIRFGDAAIIALIRILFGERLDEATDIVKVYGTNGWLEFSKSWLVGPGQPFSVGALVSISIASTINKVKFRERPLVDYIWPPIPEILDPRLEHQAADIVSPFSSAAPFVGRDTEMQTLMLFAGKDSGAGPAFMFLTGAEGIGKTRLGLEWLNKLRRLDWDCGVLKGDTTTADIDKAFFRRKTAILIDNMSECLPLIDAFAQQRQRIRILVLNQFTPIFENVFDLSVRERIRSVERGELRLTGLTEAELRYLAPTATTKAVTDASGRPLYVLLGENPAYEISRRAARRLSLAANDSERRVLALAALAGPLSHELRREIPASEVDVPDLQRLFDGEDRTVLKKQIPALQPNSFADEIVLGFSQEKTDADLEAIATYAVNLNTGAFEQRLWSLWQRQNLTQQGQSTRLFLQRIFDVAASSRVQALQRELASVADRLSSLADLPVLRKDGTHDLHGLDYSANKLIELAEHRPFDFDIRMREVFGSIAAMTAYGRAKRFVDLERFGKRVLAFGAPGAVALAASAAIETYGVAGRGEDLERWGKLLAVCWKHPVISESKDALYVVATNTMNCIVNATFFYRKGKLADQIRWASAIDNVLSHSGFLEDREIRYSECGVIINLIVGYGGAAQFAEVERWSARLWKIAEMPAFAHDAQFKDKAIMGARDAIASYSTANRFEDAERWISKMLGVAETVDVGESRQIMEHVIEGLGGAMRGYANNRRFEDVERCAQQIDKIEGGFGFNKNAESVLSEAITCRSAMHSYGSVDRFDDLERWADRLFKPATRQGFRAEKKVWVEMAGAARCAINHYGPVGRLDDVERWGARLHAIVEEGEFVGDLEIGQHEAQAAHNAVGYFNRGGRFDDAKRWRVRLARVARQFLNDPLIQELANAHDVTFTSQSRNNWPYGR
jgi:hypothetical protein